MQTQQIGSDVKMCGLWFENKRMMDEGRLTLKFSDLLSNHNESFEDLRKLGE